MPQRKFPTTLPACIGQFWQDTSKVDQRTGIVKIEPDGISLEVSPALTSPWLFTPYGNGTTGVSRAQELDDQVVFGSIAAAPTRISLWGVRTSTRHSMGMPFPGAQNTESHVLRADWCITGTHLPDPSVRFHGVRADITNLNAWSALPSLYESHELGTSRWSWNFDPPTCLDASLEVDTGFLTLGPAINWNMSGLQGVKIETSSKLEVELIDGWTLNDCFEKLTIPLATLMTLLSGHQSQLRALSVWTEQDNWSSVYGYHINQDAADTSGDLLFTRNDVGFAFLARWQRVHRHLSPVPEILAAIMSGELPTVEAEAVSLATAMEALHRMLKPGVRRFKEADVDAAAAALADAAMPDSIKKSLEDALRTWWPGYSYPMRITALATEVAEVVPECIGNIGRWRQAVVRQRNNLAHGLRESPPSQDRILRMYSLNRSMRWVLLLRLLIEAAVPRTVLREAVTTSDSFLRDRDAWTSYWPKIYGKCRNYHE